MEALRDIFTANADAVCRKQQGGLDDLDDPTSEARGKCSVSPRATDMEARLAALAEFAECDTFDRILRLLIDDMFPRRPLLKLLSSAELLPPATLAEIFTANRLAALENAAFVSGNIDSSFLEDWMAVYAIAARAGSGNVRWFLESGTLDYILRSLLPTMTNGKLLSRPAHTGMLSLLAALLGMCTKSTVLTNCDKNGDDSDDVYTVTISPMEAADLVSLLLERKVVQILLRALALLPRVSSSNGGVVYMTGDGFAKTLLVMWSMIVLAGTVPDRNVPKGATSWNPVAAAFVAAGGSDLLVDMHDCFMSSDMGAAHSALVRLLQFIGVLDATVCAGSPFGQLLKR